MDGKGIKIRFEAEEAPVRSALTKVEKSIKTITKDLKELDRLLELDPDNINLLTQKQEQLGSAIVRTTKNLQAMENANGDITKGYQKWQENQKAIEENADAITKMTAELNNAKSAMQSMASTGGKDIKLTEEYKTAAATVESLTKSLSELKSEQSRLEMADSEAIPAEVYQKYIRDVEALRINLRQLQQQQTEVNEAISAGGLVAQRVAAEEQERMRIEQQAAAAEQERSRAAEEAARAAKDAAKAAEAQAKADEERKRAAERAAEADRQAKKASENYKNALDKLKTSANNVKNDIKEMASAAFAGVTAIGSAVAAGTAAVTKTGMEFTSSMSNVKALSGATIEDMELLKEAASEAGASTSKSASESADALGYMALAGWDTNEMLEGLMPILRASEAGAMDLATCSDLVTDSMSALGVATGDLKHYLDICSKAQSSANTSMEQLLQAYVGCGGMLKALNVPLETSATLLGTLANRGIKGSEAGTALNSILVNLIGANKNAASAMRDMGISAFDAQGRFIGLEETLKLVKSKLDEYGDDTEKITQLEAKLGGKTQLDTLQALLSGVSGEYDSLNTKITNCNGALESTAKTMQDNLTGDITSLKSALEGVENSIFNSLEEPFRSAAQNVTKELRDLNSACSEGELADSLKRSAQALSEFISKMAAFAADDAFPTLIKWLEWVANNADAIISAITGMGVAWVSWKIMQYATHLQELVSAVNLVKSASAASAAAQGALAASGTAAAASEEALAAAAQTMATAQMIAYAAVIALTAALAAFIAKQIDAAAESLRNKNQLDETTQAIYDQANAYEAAAKAAEENSREADKSAEVTKSYWQQVQSLVDENGKATGSSEELERAVMRLNEAAGTNIQVVNGQIQGYSDLVSSMDDYIERARRAAKLSSMEANYGEAVSNIDDVTEQYNKAYADRIIAYSKYEKNMEELRKMEAAGNYDPAEYNRLLAENEVLGDQLAEATVRCNSLSELKDSYAKTMTEYEDLLRGPSPTKEEAMKQAGESEARRMEEINRQNAELAAKGVEQTWEELEASLNDLDNSLAIKAVSEEDYWEQRRQLLQDSQYKESAEWWKYFDEVEDHYSKLAETEKKAQEKAAKEQKEADEKAAKEQEDSIKDQIDQIKERQELDNSYTKKMMYKDMETIISGLNKESDLYKKYNSEILKGRKALADDVKKAEVEKNKEKVTEIEKLLKQEVTAYQKALQDKQKERDNYFNKWYDTSKFTSTSKQKNKNGDEADVFSLADPKEALKEIEKYEKAEEKLTARGVSQNVLDWIDTLDKATAKDTIDTLNHMSDSKLKAYSENFDKYKAKVEQKTEDKYGPQIKDLNQNFIEKVDGLIAQLPDRAAAEGENTVAGFIAGLENKSGDLSEAVTSFTDEVINGIKKNLDIHSPSKETGELGENTAQGFLNKFSAEDVAGAVDNFTDTFLAKLAQKDPDIRSALEGTFTGNLANVLANMDSLADTALNDFASAFGGKMPDLPDVTRLSLPSSKAVGDAAGGIELTAISEILDKLDRLNDIFSLIQSLSVSSDGQTVKLQIEITGRLETDMDRLVAVIVQKINNLSIQTGRQVLSL